MSTPVRLRQRFTRRARDRCRRNVFRPGGRAYAHATHGKVGARATSSCPPRLSAWRVRGPRSI